MRALFVRIVLSCFLVYPLFAEAPDEEMDLVVVGEHVVDYLNAWCPDAWCAGDFNHVFLSMTHDTKQKAWHMRFLSYLHEMEDAANLSSVSVRSNFAGTIKSGPFLSHLSECSFPALQPLQFFTFTTTNSWHLTGLTDTMSEMLFNCVNAIEKLYR